VQVTRLTRRGRQYIDRPLPKVEASLGSVLKRIHNKYPSAEVPTNCHIDSCMPNNQRQLDARMRCGVSLGARMASCLRGAASEGNEAMTKKYRGDQPMDLGKHHPSGEEPQSENTLDRQRTQTGGGDDTREEREPLRRASAVCICPSCGRTEAQLPTTPCYEMMCPRCRVPMRKA
jgi:hypothetical protein